MKNKITTLSLALLLITSACTSPGNTSGINKATGGTILGGAAGGLAGNQIGKGKGKTVATIGGAVLGGLAGNSVGSSLDRADNPYGNSYNTATPNNSYADNQLQNALESGRTGESFNSVNPDGSRTSITPTSTYSSNGMPCRGYIIANGYGGQSSGTACRQPNGVWR